MKHLVLSVFLAGSMTNVSAADFATVLQQDLDNDGKPDTVSVLQTPQQGKTIRVYLSAANQDIHSNAVEWLSGEPVYLNKTKSGFVVHVSFMRGGNIYRFAYEPATKKIRLIGWDSESFGNASHDGAGKGSLNLLTGRFIGDWQKADNRTQLLLSYPKLQEKWSVKPMYLDDVNLDKALDTLWKKMESARERQVKRKPIRWE